LEKKINYGIIGSSGKMGKEVSMLIEEEGNRAVFKYDLSGESFISKPDVLIDFSLPDAFEAVLKFAEKFEAPLVTGTTGLTGASLESLKKLSRKFPVVQSYNFSIGIQMLLKCTSLLGDALKDWDVEISETHHRFKIDKPSGTALMFKEILDKEVNISSHRIGNIAGEHTIFFGSLGEVIELKHKALSRRAFAEGALLSAKFCLGKKNGFYSFNDVLFNKDV
jgi:4-hydroxy-tetrahydrodipicolinate reductase